VPINPKTKTNDRSLFDTAIYAIAIVAPLMTLPQFYNVWVTKRVTGVSVPTWGAYAVISLFWVVYGTKNKLKPIILTNGLLLLIDSLIVIGVLLSKR
jgi:uncharacterized protein with PQ loop repeat